MSDFEFESLLDDDPPAKPALDNLSTQELEAEIKRLQAEITRRKEDEAAQRLALQQKWINDVAAQVEVMRAELKKYNSMVEEARLNNAYIYSMHFSDFITELFHAGFVMEPEDDEDSGWQPSQKCY